MTPIVHLLHRTDKIAKENSFRENDRNEKGYQFVGVIFYNYNDHR